jgi:hypothetical protein
MGRQASLGGRLTLDQGCLYLVRRENGERWIPVFRSPNTRWNAASRTVETNWGGSFRVGEFIRLGGGTASPQTWSKPPPAGCTGDRYWLVTEQVMPPMPPVPG